MCERLNRIKESRIKIFNLFQQDNLTMPHYLAQRSLNETSNTKLSRTNYRSNGLNNKEYSNRNIFVNEVQPYFNKSPKLTTASRFITHNDTLNQIIRPMQNISTRKINNSSQFFPLDELKLFDKKIIKKNPPLTPKTKSGQVFFNSYFYDNNPSTDRPNIKEVTNDKILMKLNVIDCLAMDNYDRMYNKFNKYASIFKFDKNKIQKGYRTYINNKSGFEKSTLEQLYSKDLIITNKFIKSQEKLLCLPSIKKIEEYKQKKPKMHYTFNKIKEKLKYSFNSLKI
jgi:hypothetical protein